MLTVQHAGHVLRNPVDKSSVAYDTAVGAGAGAARGAGAANNIPLPAGVPLGADARGLAYIAGTYGGNPYLIGIVHNMYAMGDKTAAFQNLPHMADAARKRAGGIYAAAQVLLGGDFNRPPQHGAVRAPIRLSAHAARVGGGVVAPTSTPPCRTRTTSGCRTGSA
jgi:hypothetical protein